MPDATAIQIADLQRAGKLPARLTQEQLRALKNSLENHARFVAGDALEEVLDTLRDGLLGILNPKQVRRDGAELPVTEGPTPASLRGELTQLLSRFGDGPAIAEEINLAFKLKTVLDVADGAGKFVREQTDVDEYPAWEFVRTYDRKEPRLWKGDEGTEDKCLGAGFASRWYQAAQQSGDVDAARMLLENNRMIALKSSGIWAALGSFDDGLDNPFPPFAFNSGMDVEGVPYNECVQLGLIEDGEKPEGADFDFGKLFAMPEREAA